MATIRVKKLNEVYLQVKSVWEVEEDLARHFSFEKPNSRFKKGEYCEPYRLYYSDGNKLYVGLLPRLEEFAKEHHHTLQKDEESFITEAEREYEIMKSLTVNVLESFDPATREYQEARTITMEPPEKDYPANEEEFRARVKEFKVEYKPGALLGDFEMNSPPKAIRDYQIDTILNIIRQERGIILFPHGEDKFPVLCCLLRWLLEKGKKCLCIIRSNAVTESLYKRLEASFPKEREACTFYMSDHIQKISTGFPKEVSKPVVLANRQSIDKQPKEWFEQFDVVMAYEVDEFNSDPLISIMKQVVNARHRIGFADTIKGAKTHKLILEGLFGGSVVCENPEEAKDKSPDLDVTFLTLAYPDEVKEGMKGRKRADEIKFIQQNRKRNEFICDMACQLEGNTLVLFEKTEQGKALCDLMLEKLARDGLERKVFFSAGPIAENDEETMRVNIKKNSGCIVVASYRRVDTGFRIPYMANIVLASPYSNEIRKLKDIGTGLLSCEKPCHLYDIADDLCIGDWQNPTMTDAGKRRKGYEKENITIKIEDVRIGS